MPEPQEFQPMEGGNAGERGEPSVSAKDIARSAAAEAVRGTEQSTTPPGTRFDSTVRPGGDQEEALESPESQTSQFEGMEGEEQQQTQPRETETQQAESPETASTQRVTMEEYQQLQEMGIDLPVAPDDVPDEFQDAYAALTQNIIDTHHSAQEQTLQAQEQILGIKEFVERLKTPEGQQRLLLGIAMNNEESFNDVVDTVRRMQEDPDFADTVQRRLEADLRLEAAERKERAMQQASMRNKGRQVESRTERLARRHGIDPEFAKEQVAQRILVNEQQTGQRDITLQEVDEVVNGLARRMGTQRTKSPKTQKAQETAPTKPAEGTGRTPGADTQDQQARQQRAQQESSDPLDRLRQAVKTSARNVRSKGL